MTAQPAYTPEEQLRAAFIESQGDAAGAIADTWVAELRFEDQDSALALVQDDVRRRRESLRIQLRGILRANLNAFELAQNVEDFEMWVEQL